MAMKKLQKCVFKKISFKFIFKKNISLCSGHHEDSPFKNQRRCIFYHWGIQFYKYIG